MNCRVVLTDIEAFSGFKFPGNGDAMDTSAVYDVIVEIAGAGDTEFFGESVFIHA